MKITDRIKQFIDYKGISLNAFDRSIGAGVSYIGKQITKQASMGSDVLEKIIITYPEINPMWLFIGEGEMIKGIKSEHTPTSNTQVHEHIEDYLTISPPAKTAYPTKNTTPITTPNTQKRTVKGGVKEYLTPQIITVDRHGKENILYVPVRARAGYLTGYGDPAYLGELTSFSLPGLQGGTYRSFEVDGPSMEPTLMNKELVIGQWVESLDYIREDHVHIIVTKTDGIVIKRILNRIEKYGYIVAKSDAVENRHLYPNLNIYPEDILEVWFAYWHGSFTFKSPAEMYQRVNNLEADLTEVLRLLKDQGLKQ